MPTIRQKKAVKALGENGGIISKAMKTAGYAPSIIHATEKLTNSMGFKELMKEELPEGYLLKKHRKLLDKVDKYGELDVQAVTKALDMAYKLNNRYESPAESPNTKTVVAVQVIINGSDHPEGRTDTETVVSA